MEVVKDLFAKENMAPRWGAGKSVRMCHGLQPRHGGQLSLQEPLQVHQAN